MDPEFLRLLVCPRTRQPLRPATPAELAAVNAAITAGRAKNRGGDTVARELEAGLVPTSGDALYPVLDGIPILLSGEAIPLSEPAA